MKLAFKVLLLVLINQIPVSILFGKFIVFLIENVAKLNLIVYASPDKVPSFINLLIELCGSNVLLEISSFYAHRLMHHKLFYKRFHKIHHEFHVPLPMGALYNHPIEHVIMNLIPIFIGPFILRIHLSSAIIWLMINLICGITDHANLHLPLLKSPRFHNFHHESSTGNFGITGLMDFIYGTDKQFRASKRFKNHGVLWPCSMKFPKRIEQTSRTWISMEVESFSQEKSEKLSS